MYLSKAYYPTYWSGCNAIHAVTSWSKVRKLVRDARAGASIPPILIEGALHSGNLLNGTHRAAANDILMMTGHDDCLIDYISIDDINVSDELQSAIDNCDYELIDSLLDR